MSASFTPRGWASETSTVGRTVPKAENNKTQMIDDKTHILIAVRDDGA